MEIKLAGNTRSSIPYFEQWFGQWAMYEPSARALQELVAKTDILKHVSSSSRQDAMDDADGYSMEIIDGIALISLNGALMKHVQSMQSGTSTVLARRCIRAAVEDDRVKGILLKIESPGGTVAGTKELADEVAKANAIKPVRAFVSDLCASAAYWIASQCESIEANATAMVGSIGTYCVVVDSSAAAEQSGLKVHVIKAGKYKGAGAAGTEVTEEDIADVQEKIDGLNYFFLDAVSNGRKLLFEQVSEMADGRVHLANKALELGLIDGVSTADECFENFLASVSQGVSSPAQPVVLNSGVDAMADSTTASPATVAEIRAKCSQASADWILYCVEKRMSLQECQASYIEFLQAKMEASLAATTKPGVSAVKIKAKSESMDDMEDSDEEEEDSPMAAWNAAVAKEVKACNGDRQRAVSAANRKNPGLRNRLLQSVNGR